MKYSDCTLPELQRFAKDRKLTVRTTRSKRRGPTEEDYIKVLEQDDQCPAVPFRFLTLPAEMRNRVYNALLDNGSPNTAHPNVLGVCRQIYDEAYEIPLSANEFDLSVAGSTIQIGGLKCGISSTQHGEAVMEIQWPDFLRKVQSMRLVFVYPRSLYTEDTRTLMHGAACNHEHVLLAAKMNHVLFSIFSFLSVKSDLKRLTIDLDSLLEVIGPPERLDACHCLQAIFRPLRFFASITKDNVSIHSTNNSTNNNTLVQAIQNLWYEPLWIRSSNTDLPSSFKPIKRAQATMDLDLKSTAFDQKKPGTGSNLRPSWQGAHRHLYPRPGTRPTKILIPLLEIQSLFGSGRFIDRSNEQSLSRKLGQLQEQLDLLDLEKLRGEARKHVEGKSQRTVVVLEGMIDGVEGKERQKT